MITGSLHTRDCVPLANKFCNHIELWTARFLTFAGHLQLLKVILAGIMGFRSLYIFLPKGVVKRLNALMFKFSFWEGGGVL